MAKTSIKKHIPDSALKVNAGVERVTDVSPDVLKRFLATKKKKMTVDEYVDGILKGDRVTLGKAITLVESSRSQDTEMANKIIDKCLKYSEKSIRIGITGVPGVGKSTFIEEFGTMLTKAGHKVAVLSVDPSSSKSKGSLLGDKTRMVALSADDNAFIRPSPTAGSLGGVNRKSRETIFLCEAAGYDVIIIETVGVGQSETLVHSMTDFFLLLELAGAGDELQGIKKGIMEMADGIVITKADGDNRQKALLAKSEKETALHYSMNADPDWSVPVLISSAVTKEGIDDIWDMIQKHSEIFKKTGRFFENRKEQMKSWFEMMSAELLRIMFFEDKNVQALMRKFTADIYDGKETPVNASKLLIEHFKKGQ